MNLGFSICNVMPMHSALSSCYWTLHVTCKFNVCDRKEFIFQNYIAASPVFTGYPCLLLMLRYLCLLLMSTAQLWIWLMDCLNAFRLLFCWNLFARILFVCFYIEVLRSDRKLHFHEFCFIHLMLFRIMLANFWA